MNSTESTAFEFSLNLVGQDAQVRLVLKQRYLSLGPLGVNLLDSEEEKKGGGGFLWHHEWIFFVARCVCIAL